MTLKPSSPIIPGHDLPETVYAKDQPPYQPLPVWRDDDGAVLSRWHATWRERLRILFTGDVYLWQLTFNRALQPVKLETERPMKRPGRIREWIGARCHWQNLNEDRESKVKGSILKHGRAWFHRKWDDDGGYGKQVRFSWSFGSIGRIGVEVDLFDGDSHRDISFNVALLFFWFFLTLEDWLPKKYGYPRHSWSHGTGFYYHEDSLRIEFHHAGADCYECKGYKGWYRHWFVSDLIWGRAKYSETVLSESEHALQMPECAYPVKVQLVESVWTRPRKPWPLKIKRAKMDIERGIPTPGKGENSWDCGQDATFGLTCQAASVEEAMESLRDSVMRDRERYGGKNWKPEKAEAV